jgi:hypothetical protein
MPLWNKRNEFTQTDMAYLGGLSVGCIFGTGLMCAIAGVYLECYLNGITFSFSYTGPTPQMINGHHVDLGKIGFELGSVLGIFICYIAIKIIYTDEVVRMIFSKLNGNRKSK